MKHQPFIAAGILLLSSCTLNIKTTATADNPDTCDSTLQADRGTVSETGKDGDGQENTSDMQAAAGQIRHIYDELCKLYNAGKAEEFLNNEEQYLTVEFQNLYSQAKKVEEENQDYFFDWDFWISAQDDEDLKVTGVTTTEKPGNKAAADVTLINFGTPTHIHLILKYEKGKWLIDDFIFSDDETGSSLKQSMKDYIEESR